MERCAQSAVFLDGISEDSESSYASAHDDLCRSALAGSMGGRARKIENNRRKNCNSAVKLVHIFHIIIYNGNHELIWIHLYKSFLNLYQVNQRNIIQ